ncbi:MAG: GNAT family N-acetyltransferase [Eubacterium sp.]|jgi:ribosomal protein S18 acetylase RimI-like enzyme|nr:GNAT family N-acetyltransferase [Eubacterium sp.]
MIELVSASTSDALVINGISKRSFESDVEIGAPFKGGPPGYKSIQFHTKMARSHHLYKLLADGLIIGAAILFVEGDSLTIGRILIGPEHYRKGYGVYMMQEIERMFPAAKEIFLDTPIWNIRTNSFYQKLGYTEYKRDGEFVYYTKRIACL